MTGSGTATTKDRLLDAAERLFARDGVHSARIRDINELAGQRNPSALHYHFGSRMAVVEAMRKRHNALWHYAVEPKTGHEPGEKTWPLVFSFLRHSFARTVARTVVHGDDLEVRERLAPQRDERTREPGARIADGQQYGKTGTHARTLARRATGCIPAGARRDGTCPRPLQSPRRRPRLRHARGRMLPCTPADSPTKREREWNPSIWS